MIKKTKDYDIFVFRDDNRKDVSEAHVRALIKSIKSKNMLEMRPIIVNEDMEIMDGQHRLFAARELNLEIYYEIQNDLQPRDIILMNIAKSWTTMDYLNFYVKNGYKEYMKFEKFCIENSIEINLGIAILMGQRKQGFNEFREGSYIFPENEYKNYIYICKETILLIQRLIGYSAWTKATRFWKAMLTVIQHPNFSSEKWYSNIEKLISRIGIRASQKEYEKMFVDIFNWKTSTNTIQLEKK